MRSLGERLLHWASEHRPWTNVYGLARSILALSTLLTLAASDPTTLFRPAAGLPESPACEGVRRFALFCLAGKDHLELARWLAVFLLLVVASGWRPRLTALPHWWISVSLQATATTLDGGDQAAAVLTFILLPIALLDRRRWHWSSSGPLGTSVPGQRWTQLVAMSALIAFRVQVSAIYFHAAVGKMGVPEWVDGTALYYWLTDPMFGLQEPVVSWLWPLLAAGSVVTVVTWLVILLELALTIGLVLPNRFWPFLLGTGILFHVGIYLLHGLASFALTMIGALIIYFRPSEREFAGLSAWLSRFRSSRRFSDEQVSASLPP